MQWINFREQKKSYSSPTDYEAPLFTSQQPALPPIPANKKTSSVSQEICKLRILPFGSTRWVSKNPQPLAASITGSAPPPLHQQTGFLDHSNTRNICQSMWISDFGGSDLATTFCKQAISLRPSSAQPGLSSWANNSGTSAGDMHGIGPARYVPPFRCVASWVMWCRSDVLEVRDAAVVYEATTAAAIAMILLWGSGWLSISCSFQHCSFMFISSIEMYGRWFTIHSSLHILYTTVYRGFKMHMYVV